MKKICCLLLAGLVFLSACGKEPAVTENVTTSVPAGSETASLPESTEAETATETEAQREIIVWAFGSEAEPVRKQCEEFLKTYSVEGKEPVITVKSVNAEDVIDRMKEASDTGFSADVLPDVEEMPDLFFFFSDDFDVLLKAGLLSRIPDANAAKIRENTVGSACLAAEADGTLYAYPAALEDTQLLFYDTSRIGEFTDLADLIACCAEENRYFYAGSDTTVFPASVFYSFGLRYTTKVRADGSIAAADCDFYTEKGLQAALTMQELMSADEFRFAEGSLAYSFSYTEEPAAAVIADSYFASDMKVVLGEDYGVAALPGIVWEEELLPEVCCGTYIMIGVAPKKDGEKLAACHALAEHLLSDKLQLERFAADGAIPVSLSALDDAALQDDETAAAMVLQLPYVLRRAKVSNGYYDEMNRFTAALLEGGSSLKKAKLQQMLDELSAFLMADTVKAKE